MHILLGCDQFHAVELADEIIVPIGAAIFAIGGGAQADAFLLLDGVDDAAILNLAQGFGAEFTQRALGAGFTQRNRAQQRADMVGAERWAGADWLRHFVFLRMIFRNMPAIGQEARAPAIDLGAQ